MKLGGQKSRVAFAHITWKNPHLILLDEVRRFHSLLLILQAYKSFGHGYSGCTHSSPQ